MVRRETFYKSPEVKGITSEEPAEIKTETKEVKAKIEIKKDIIKGIAICEHGLREYNNRKFKRNNPGNIICSSWCDNKCIGRFCSFETIDDGFKAMEGLLSKYYGHMTVNNAIYKYAPPSENDTSGHTSCIKQYGLLTGGELVKNVL